MGLDSTVSVYGKLGQCYPWILDNRVVERICAKLGNRKMRRM